MIEENEYVFKIDDYGLRNIREEDLPLLLEWRNSPRIHSKMFTDHKITPQEHQAWFKRIQADPVKKNFVFTYKGQAVGYIGYTVFDKEQNIYSVGSYIGEPKKCPVNAGLFLEYVCSAYGFTKLKIPKICIEIFADNKKAFEINMALGFNLDTAEKYYVMKDGEKRLVVRNFVDKEDWAKGRQDFLDLFLGVEE